MLSNQLTNPETAKKKPKKLKNKLFLNAYRDNDHRQSECAVLHAAVCKVAFILSHHTAVVTQPRLKEKGREWERVVCQSSYAQYMQ